MDGLFDTRDSKNHPLIKWERPAIAVSMAMLAEQKMWLSVLLYGIMESDPSFILPSTGRQPDRDNEIIRRSTEAREWRDSEDFDACCHCAQIDPAYARLLTPEKASRAYQALSQGETATFIETELGDKHDESEDLDV